jgi:uncharacterized protein (TIGR00725 family)
MEGAARGAREAGGPTIGLLPGFDPDDANAYIDYPIATGLGEVRNVLIVRAADALIAFPGKYGTLSEMALALQAGKPIVSVNAWKLDDAVPQFDDPIRAAEAAVELARKQ